MAGGKQRGILGWSTLDVLNIAKTLTLTSIAAFVTYNGGMHNMRQVLSVSLQSTYLVYWFLHQHMLPSWHPFSEPADIAAVIVGFGIVGAAYAMPVWLSYNNPTPMPHWAAAACIFIFSMGNFINCGSDWYKAGAKDSGAGMVATGPFRFALRMNYFGDWLRYLSFALCAGRICAFFVPAFVMLSNLSTIPAQIQEGKKKYGKAFTSYAATTPAIVPGFAPAIPAQEAQLSLTGK